MGAGGEARGRRRWFGSCDLVDDEEGGLERRGDASAPARIRIQRSRTGQASVMWGPCVGR